MGPSSSPSQFTRRMTEGRLFRYYATMQTAVRLCDIRTMTAKRRKRRAPPIRALATNDAGPSASPRRSPEHTSQATRARGDVAHLILLLAALGLSYLLPFELFVLSYAILGPAHYLTEISWLHDRKYFLPHRAIAAVLCAVALGAMFVADSFWLGLIVSFSFVACAILAIAPTQRRIWACLAVAGICFAAVGQLDAPFRIAWILLPTLIHVSLFTLLFMTAGALRSRSPAQFALIAVYLAAIVLILAVPPSRATVVPELGAIGKEYFGDIAPALGSVLGMPDLTFNARITGLLSFVYTYHYLNWFIKADVIRWTAVPRPRLIGIAALSLAATGLYFFNYAYGFMVLLLLSLIHVLLEFPLNSLCMRQLGSAVGERFLQRSARSA
ncbi:hypothetical protein [Rudaea sp.]|uniref:hypothetical protein n=2 Tax=unclassified Rudaea TaxID=2627037 RepID=UPI0025D27706|nr:hypothetical protein [Rudaea sp.]